MACLALLKLYQFNPQETEPYIVASILALALASGLPEPDFTMCLYMVSDEALLNDPIVVHLTKLNALLEKAQFAAFWQTIDSDNILSEIVADYPLFEETIREFIAQTLEIAYQTISIDLLEQSLDLSGEDLAVWVKAREGWKVNASNEELIDIPHTVWNTAKSVSVQEDIKVDQIAKLISKARVLQ